MNEVSRALRKIAEENLEQEARNALDDLTWLKKPVREWTKEQTITYLNDANQHGTLLEILRTVQDMRDNK